MKNFRYGIKMALVVVVIAIPAEIIANEYGNVAAIMFLLVALYTSHRFTWHWKKK